MGRVAAHDTPAGVPAITRPVSRPRSGRDAAYYRLRSIALEARVQQLEADLERTERRLQESIDRYEQILQRRPATDGVVSIDEPRHHADD